MQWIEDPAFRDLMAGTFVRVVYHRQYVIGQIEDFKEEKDVYKVETRETKHYVTLKNGGKSKDFRLNHVSDGYCLQKEFDLLKLQNKNLIIDHEFIQTQKKKI